MSTSPKNPHFFLKFISLILLVLAIVLAAHPSKMWYQDIIAEGLTDSSTIVLLVLVVTLIFFESKRAAEICLIVAVVGMLIISCSMWVPRHAYPITNAGADGQLYTVFYNEQERRNAYFGLTLPAIILEIVDLILYAINK